MLLLHSRPVLTCITTNLFLTYWVSICLLMTPAQSQDLHLLKGIIQLLPLYTDVGPGPEPTTIPQDRI